MDTQQQSVNTEDTELKEIKQEPNWETVGEWEGTDIVEDPTLQVDSQFSPPPTYCTLRSVTDPMVHQAAIQQGSFTKGTRMREKSWVPGEWTTIQVSKKSKKQKPSNKKDGGQAESAVEPERDEEEKLDLDASAHDDGVEKFTAPLGEMDKEEIMKEGESKKKKRGRKRKLSGYKFESYRAELIKTAVKAAAEKMGKVLHVDLSQKVDHMFRSHISEQEMSGMAHNTPTTPSRSKYICNLCEKEFTCLSRIRRHCVTHTDIKPFKCDKCSYSTNYQGYLPAHKKSKHTGPYYKCNQCDFETHKNSFLKEHKLIHDNGRPECLMCHKECSTPRSLYNHIQKYHKNKKGKEYLQTILQDQEEGQRKKNKKKSSTAGAAASAHETIFQDAASESGKGVEKESRPAPVTVAVAAQDSALSNTEPAKTNPKKKKSKGKENPQQI